MQHFDFDRNWEGSIPHRGESEDLDDVGLWGNEVLDGGD